MPKSLENAEASSHIDLDTFDDVLKEVKVHFNIGEEVGFEQFMKKHDQTAIQLQNQLYKGESCDVFYRVEPQGSAMHIYTISKGDGKTLMGQKFHLRQDGLLVGQPLNRLGFADFPEYKPD